VNYVTRNFILGIDDFVAFVWPLGFLAKRRWQLSPHRFQRIAVRVARFAWLANIRSRRKMSEDDLQFHYRGNNLKGLLCGLLKCDKQKVRIWTITVEQDEPIPQKETMKLAKPIRPGFRRPVTLTPDEDVDQAADGTFATIEILSGDSQVVYNPESTAKSIKVWFYGDGATGDKSARITVDGHVGDGDQPVSLDFDWTVASPDATSFKTIVEGEDEAIPS
jgi:hypothetical protein